MQNIGAHVQNACYNLIIVNLAGPTRVLWSNVKKEIIMTTIAEVFAQVGLKVNEDMLAELETLLQVKKPQKGSKKYVFNGDTFEAKTPLQMKQAVLAIKGEGEVDLKTWAEKLQRYEGFKTQQPVERIIAYYKKRMLDEGLVREA